MHYFLGVDIGTTSLKAIAFNERGEAICKHAADYAMQHPQPAYAEQNCDEIFKATVVSINAILSALHPVQPDFISFSSMMHSFIVVDKTGEPLTNCLIWADNRAAAIADRLRLTDEGEQLYHTTGVPVHAMSPFCKILWLKENAPAIFENAHKFIGIKEYIFFRLFGYYAVDTPIASATGLLNLHSLQWDKDILETLQVSEDKLSIITDVEAAFYYRPNNGTSVLFQLSAQVPFIIGGSDGALANLGMGSDTDTSLSVTIGTSAAVRILSSYPVTEETGSIFCYHATGTQYIVGGASNNGGVVLQWLKEKLLQCPESYAELFSLAETVPPGSDNLVFIPYILGERAPVWNANAQGVFLGLTVRHTKAHMVRAVLEGITYNLYSIRQLIATKSPVTTIYASGGFAQNPFWLQMLADVFRCRVIVSGSPESSALGAVIIGIKAVGLSYQIHPTIVAEHFPNDDNQHIYEKCFYRFERIYDLLKSEFSNMEMLNNSMAI